MLPSDVRMDLSYPPFVGTFQKTECEIAAAFLVRGLAETGNTWRAIRWEEIEPVLSKDLNVAKAFAKDATSIEQLMASLIRNPFAKPDFDKLATLGYARWLDGRGSAMEFTDAGLERLRKWCPPAELTS